jgi:plastocyanin
MVSGSSGTYGERSAARPDLGAEHFVRMTDRGGFEPAQIKINMGDTVTWRNESGKTHSVTADADKAADPAHVVLPKDAEKFDSGDIAPSQTFSQSFSTPGIYHYICRPHEHKGMVGTVIVMDPNAAEDSHEHSGSEAPPPAPEGSRSSY